MERSKIAEVGRIVIGVAKKRNGLLQGCLKAGIDEPSVHVFRTSHANRRVTAIPWSMISRDAATGEGEPIAS
jgi:hypothetical protein